MDKILIAILNRLYDANYRDYGHVNIGAYSDALSKIIISIMRINKKLRTPER